MISVDSGNTATYVYNALGQRVEKDVGGYYTEYLFDKDGSVAGEYNRTSWESWADPPPHPARSARHPLPKRGEGLGVRGMAEAPISRTWTGWGQQRL